VFFIVTLLFVVGENNYLPRQCNFVLVREHEIRTRFTKVACHAWRVSHHRSENEAAHGQESSTLRYGVRCL